MLVNFTPAAIISTEQALDLAITDQEIELVFASLGDKIAELLRPA